MRFLALLNVAVAFNVQRSVARQTRLYMEGETPAPRTRVARMNAFDPFALPQAKNGLYWIKAEAEVRHGRLALLAGLAPLSELGEILACALNFISQAMLFSILVVGLLAFDYAIEEGDVILEPSSTSGKQVCVLMIQGAEIEPYAYIPLMKAVQLESKDLSVWVGIPQFPGNFAFEVGSGVDRILLKMREKGMNTTTLIMAGHSLGGAMVQAYTAENADKVTAQVLMGSFLARSWKQDYVFNYNVPTLTIGGELDGIARVTRFAEAFYSQLLDPAVICENAFENSSFPVVVVQGVTHMQFASGLPPSRVYRLDLVPERTYAEAHRLIARDFSAFLSAKTLSVLGALEGEQAMQERLAQTHAFVAPLLEALHLEGYHNFRPPCVSRCSTECSSCTAGCPFSAVSQATMGGLQGIPLTNTDSFGTRLPKVQRSDEGVRTQTSTQGCYHTGEDLQIWDLHFHSRGLDLDTGSLPLSAFELKTKMKSRQSLHRLAGIDFCGDEVGGGMGVCGEINQQSVDWAHAHAGPATLARYTAYGQKYTIGPDMDVRSGPCWIWNELEYAESEDGETVQVRSPSLCTPLHIPLPPLSGLHYCKVLSPARVLEWMYVDSLRAKYSLSTYSPPHSAYSQSTNGTA